MPSTRAQDRVAIRAVAVEGAIAARQRGALHRRDAVRERARRRARPPRAAARCRACPGSMSHSWHGTPTRREAARLRPEVVAQHVVDEDHVRIAQLGGPAHRHRVDGLGPRGKVEARSRWQSRRDHAPAATTTLPASMRPAEVSTPRTRLSPPVDPRHRGPLEDPRAQLGGAAAEALHGLGRIRVAALGLVGRRAHVVDVGEGLQRPAARPDRSRASCTPMPCSIATLRRRFSA